MKLPQAPLDPETVAVIILVTGGNFRLLNRLLTQIQRMLEMNTLDEVSKAVVEAPSPSSLPVANSAPDCITAGPDGNLWFTEALGNKIGQLRRNALKRSKS